MNFNLRELRESKHMTQAELAEKSGISRYSIIKLETGKSEYIRSSTAVKLAEALGISPKEFFFG